MTENPLSKYTMKPGIFVRLPSQGKYYTQKPKLSVDGDIEVHPMTAIDEMYLKNPDGLYNNESLYKVIKNTIPAITDPSEVSTADLDSLFIAIRIATYGKEMDVSSKCPKCNHITEYSVDLTKILQTLKPMSEIDELDISGLKIKIRPYTIETNARVAEYTMNVSIAAKAVQDSVQDETSEEKKRELSRTISEASESLIKLIAESVVSVTTPENEVVTDKKFILEFVQSMTSKDYTKLRNAVADLSKELIDRKVKFVCEKCQTENTGEVTFDPANFFE